MASRISAGLALAALSSPYFPRIHLDKASAESASRALVGSAAPSAALPFTSFRSESSNSSMDFLMEALLALVSALLMSTCCLTAPLPRLNTSPRLASASRIFSGTRRTESSSANASSPGVMPRRPSPESAVYWLVRRSTALTASLKLRLMPSAMIPPPIPPPRSAPVAMPLPISHQESSASSGD